MQSDQDTQPVKVTLSEPKITGGRWDFVIGLVGKPSAGKSTFFNAATTLDLAKTGSHPFTTIEPNVGKAFYSVPCPCGHLGIRCSAAHGHSYAGERHVPVLLKDVAGLVPGACDGKGRGNRFLNDLLDADVLMHIVDVSGSTNEKGEKTIGYDPSQDVTWLQQEIHRWIYDNVMDKWDTIRRRPEKLIDMFTGYHANKATIHAAMQNAEIDARELSRVASWEAATLHRLVREFLRLRFPIFLVLNKADTETAQQNIQRLEESHPDIPRLAVSAKAENYLQSLAKAAVIQYEYGDSTFTVSSSVSPADKHKLDRISTEVLQRYGSSNVHRALCEAVRLRSPSYAFPVQCLDTLTSIDKFKDQAAGALRDCVTLRPGTTVEELYTAMMHYPLLLLAGDFIRAECLDDTGKKRIVRKDEVIDKYNCIIKIMTNRKVTQVKARD